MVKVLPSSRQTHEQARVDQASQYLKRCYVAERQLMRTLAAWFVDTSQWDFKRQLGQDMWETSRHADALRTRVLELRYPRRDVDKKYDAGVLAWAAEFAKGQNTEEFIAGIYGAVLPELIRAYQEYLELTDSLDDAPTVYILRHSIADKEQQIERMRACVTEVSPGLFDAGAGWADYLRQYAASIGGVSGQGQASSKPDSSYAGRPDYQVGRQVQRDPRWRPALFHLPHENKYDVEGRKAWGRIEALDKRVAMQVWSAISHFNEIWAAEVVAASMWDFDSEPWDFYLDLARWAWDESRHSTMGYRALEGWGWDVPELIPWGNALYNAMGPMPPIQRLALLYFYEEGLLRAGTKQTEIKILESAQDDGSVQDMDFDWADEAIHVSYGFKWLRHLLGDDNAGKDELKRLTDEARAIVAQFVLEHKDEPEAKLAPYFDRLHDVIAGMLQEIPDDGLQIQWAPVVADEEVLKAL
jgi:ferritin-like metal-binding protein YciE